MWKVSSTKRAKIFRGKAFGKCNNTPLRKISCAFSVLQGFKLLMPIVLSIGIVIFSFWLQIQNTGKHARLSCGTILQESCSCDHQIHLSRWNRWWWSFLGMYFVHIYSSALCISERWHRQPLKRASSGLTARRRLAAVQAVDFQERLFCFNVADVCQFLCPHPTTLTAWLRSRMWYMQNVWIYVEYKKDGVCAVFLIWLFLQALRCFHAIGLPYQHSDAVFCFDVQPVSCLSISFNTRFVNLVLLGFRLSWGECILSLVYMRGMHHSSIATVTQLGMTVIQQAV